MVILLKCLFIYYFDTKKFSKKISIREFKKAN